MTWYFLAFLRIEELLEGVQSELAIKIYGEDQKVMTQISKDIQKALEGLDGLEEIEIEPQLGQANIIITPNYQALARYGIRVDEIMQLVRNGIGEEPITQKIEGSEIQYPLSVVIVGGIISSTVLTLLVLPVGYFLVYKKR
jgi:cobalt-zinc-cadmium resistance protein CzcA